ncbi:NADP-dependent oxidoreductase [Lentzea sp. NPDC004782]|uniref:NADP-dependent oxidoreductase n=1 Tax=Lentzea sp. NPDC004782 TaxID=3154458 RepID=UPI0033A6B767
MPKAVVMTGAGAPDVLKWTDVPPTEPAAGQVRIKVRAAGISPTDLALRSGRLKAFPLPENAVLGFQVAGTVDAVDPSTTGANVGDEVVAFLLQLGGYAEYAIASIWTPKPATVSWTDAAALPSAAEAAVRVLRELDVRDGERLVLFGGAGAVGTIATQLAVRQGVTVISAVGNRDLDFARELGAIPVRYGDGVVERIRALGGVDAVFDAAGAGVLGDAITLAGQPDRVITLSDPAAAQFGVRLSGPDAQRATTALAEVIALLADQQLRLRPYTVAPMSDADQVHRQLESGELHGQIVLTVD